MNNRIVTIGIVGIVVIAGFLAIRALSTDPTVVYHSPTESSSSASSESSVTTTPEKTPVALPASVLIDVPFMVQAPFANWDALHEESCEEAALLMAWHYMNQTPVTEEIAEQEIQDIVAWEGEHSYGYDVNAQQMSVIAKEKLNMDVAIRTDVTVESIKQILAEGHPIIVPAAGRQLGNPYFSGEGPWYHALIIIGYKSGLTGEYFITNDPGTKRGKQYAYRVDTLVNAIHDWTGVNEKMNEGRKVMLIVE